VREIAYCIASYQKCGVEEMKGKSVLEAMLRLIFEFKLDGRKFLLTVSLDGKD
jgi:hypothetical protein